MNTNIVRVCVHACVLSWFARIFLFDAVFNLTPCLSFVQCYSSSLLHGKDWRLRLICVLSDSLSVAVFLLVLKSLCFSVHMSFFQISSSIHFTTFSARELRQMEHYYANLIISWRKLMITLGQRKPLALLPHPAAICPQLKSFNKWPCTSPYPGRGAQWYRQPTNQPSFEKNKLLKKTLQLEMTVNIND